ncbi:MAG: efflux RND transporter periplasmic adaptor subunit [Sphingobacteriales bacterium]|nr:efflux RND transporter periplasmic adaptor subunit [Sphingobacteriales bacterium]MBI3719643.1 efflux RND transporter periplasmic adaptor subunit [Sphingobacteriales bacterium]
MRNIFYTIAAFVVLQACKSKATETKSIINTDVIPVKLMAINSDTNLAAITASGIVSTENEAKLSFKIGGVIESVLVKEGDKVKAGQLLATLKSVEIAAQVQQVQLAVEKAQRDYQRASNLYKDSVATLEQLQNAKTGVDIAKQNLQQVLFNQQYSKIYSPVDGFVVKKNGNAGELASSGSPVIILNALSAKNKWILKAGLSDKEWASVEVGNKATIIVDAFPGKTFNAVVSKKALAADAVSGSFPVELQIDFGNEKPAVGMFGNVSIVPTHSSVGFSIPYEALLEASGKKGYVFVTDDKKTVRKVEVIISDISNNTAYIADGLQGYKYVVTSGSPYLNDNSTITVQQ